MKKNRQISIGAILSYLNIAVGTIMTIFYTPFMIRTLGQSEYGLYNTVASVISSLSVLSLGFNSSYIRFYSRYVVEDNKEKIKQLNGMFLIIFMVIGTVSFLCGFYLTNNLNLIFDKGLSSGELQIAKKLMLLLNINLAISFPASVFSSIITANEQFVFQKSLNLLKQIVSPLLSIPLLLLGYASVGIVLCTVVINLFIEILHIVFCIYKLGVRFVFNKFDFRLLREIASYSIFIAINMLVDLVNLHLDKILLGRFCGTGAVAVYSVGYTLYNYYHTFSTAISNVFTPRIHHIWSERNLPEKEKNSKLSDLFAEVGELQFVILCLIGSGLIIFGKQFIAIWAGVGYENAYYIAILLVVSAIVPLSQNVGIEIQRAKNKHHFRSIVYAVMAFINLILSVYLCQIYGEIGTAVGTAVSFVVANTIIMNIFYHNVLEINIGLYWKKCIQIVVVLTPAYIFGVVYCTLVNTYNIGKMLLGILIYTVIYVICIMFLYRDRIQKIIKKSN